MVHHLHHANWAYSSISMEYFISGEPRIILQQTLKPNVSSNCPNVQFVRIPTLPRTVHLLPQAANSIQSGKFIVFFKDIVPYPTLLPNGHNKNNFSDKRFLRHSILFYHRYSVKSQVLDFVQFAIMIEQFAIGFSTKVKTYSFGSTSMGWRTNSTSLRFSILRRSNWKSSLFSTRFSTAAKPYQTSGFFRQSARAATG